MGWPITKPSTIYAIRCTKTGRVYIGRTYRFEARIIVKYEKEKT